MKNSLTLLRPDDWHCHFRDDNRLSRTVPDTASRFQRAIIMPNLEQPVTTVGLAKNYQDRILEHIPDGNPFTPLMTLYLTEDMNPNTLREAKASGFIVAAKLYPAGATTHSSAGIRDLSRITPLLETLQETGLLLLIHGEVPDPSVNPMDREAAFIERELIPLLKHFPKLRMVLEHISTKTAVEFIKAGPDNLAATITPHHLLLTHDADPHHHCFPIIKHAEDRAALLEAATSGNPKFFLGTDSAPHPKTKKESPCGCAGIYSAHAAIELYAEIFEQQSALDKLENFASRFGAQFYQLPCNTTTITLTRDPWVLPETLAFGDDTVVPLMAGKTLQWRLKA